MCHRSMNSRVLIMTKTLACPVPGNRVVDTDLLGAFTQHLLQLPVKEDYPGKCFIQLKTFHTSWKGWDCCLFVSFFLVQFKPPCLSVHLLLTYLHRQINSFVFYFVFCKPNKLVEKRLKRAAIIFSFPWFCPSGTQPSWKALLVTGVTGPGVPAEISIGTRWRNRISYVQNSCLWTDSSTLKHPVPSYCRQHVLQPLMHGYTEPIHTFHYVVWQHDWFLVMIFCTPLQNLIFGRTAG